jgi:hypothetical protein
MSRLKRNGVSKDASAGKDTPFPVTFENYYHLAKLVNVVVNEGEDRSGNPSLTLDFHFKSPDDKFTFTHRDFPVKDGDNRADDKLGWQDDRMAHIYNTFAGENAHAKGKGIGQFEAEDDGWEGNKLFFEALAKDFNGKGKEAKPVYQDEKGEPIYFWLKMTYGNNGYLQLPFPNFMQKYVEGEECILQRGGKEIFEKPRPSIPGAGGASPAANITPNKSIPKGF